MKNKILKQKIIEILEKGIIPTDDLQGYIVNRKRIVDEILKLFEKRKREKQIIESDIDKQMIIIRKLDYRQWLDGTKLWYELPKEEQPDFNPYDYFDEPNENVYFKLREMAKELFEMNEIPDEIIKALSEFELLSKITDKYAKHILGLILKLKNQKQ